MFLCLDTEGTNPSRGCVHGRDSRPIPQLQSPPLPLSPVASLHVAIPGSQTPPGGADCVTTTAGSEARCSGLVVSFVPTACCAPEGIHSSNMAALLPGSCGFFLEKKRRFCKMVAARGRRFCGEHATMVSSQTGWCVHGPGVVVVVVVRGGGSEPLACTGSPALLCAVTGRRRVALSGRAIKLYLSSIWRHFVVNA